MEGFAYIVEMAQVAQTAAKTLLQIKAGAAAGFFLSSVKISQISSVASQMLRLTILRKSAAATVTSFTPLKIGGTADPASLAVGGTAATGTNASAEGTDGDILEDTNWNVLNGEWLWQPVPEERIWVPAAGLIAVKLNTAPAASMTFTAVAKYLEWQ